MFFEEFVEQHRVHRVVAHSGDLAILVTHDEIGIPLGDFLRDQTKLRRICGVVLVMEGDWLQRQDGFARLLQGILIFLEAATADYADFYLLPTKHPPRPPGTKRRENRRDRIFRFVSFACFVGILIESVPSMLSAVSPWSLPI